MERKPEDEPSFGIGGPLAQEKDDTLAAKLNAEVEEWTCFEGYALYRAMVEVVLAKVIERGLEFVETDEDRADYLKIRDLTNEDRVIVTKIFHVMWRMKIAAEGEPSKKDVATWVMQSISIYMHPTESPAEKET